MKLPIIKKLTVHKIKNKEPYAMYGRIRSVRLMALELIKHLGKYFILEWLFYMDIFDFHSFFLFIQIDQAPLFTNLFETYSR